MRIGVIGGIGSGKSTVTRLLEEKYGFTALVLDDIAKLLEFPGAPVYLELVREFGAGILQEQSLAADDGRELYGTPERDYIRAQGMAPEKDDNRTQSEVLKMDNVQAQGSGLTADNNCTQSEDLEKDYIRAQSLEMTTDNNLTQSGSTQQGACGMAPIDKVKFAELIYSNKEALDRANAIIHPAVWEHVRRRCSEAGDYVIETALPDRGFPELCDEVWFVRTDAGVRTVRLMASRGYSRDKCISIMGNQAEDSWYEDLSDRVIDNSRTSREELEFLVGRLREAALSARAGGTAPTGV